MYRNKKNHTNLHLTPPTMSYADWVGKDRLERARKMYDDAPDHHIARILPRQGVWFVRSQRRAGIYYRVSPDLRVCNCPDFRRNVTANPTFLCKHLILVALVRRGGRLLRVRGGIIDEPSHLNDEPNGTVIPRGMERHVEALSQHHAYVVDSASGEPVCGHAHDEARLRQWFASGETSCPLCIRETMDLLVVGENGDPPPPKPRAKKKAIKDIVLTRKGKSVLRMLQQFDATGKKDEDIDTEGDLRKVLEGEDDPDIKTDVVTIDDLRKLSSLLKPKEWSGPPGGTSKATLVKALVAYVYNPEFRQAKEVEARSKQDKEIVYAKSSREKLDGLNDPANKMHVYGQDRCGETLVRNLGIAPLTSYQKNILSKTPALE